MRLEQALERGASDRGAPSRRGSEQAQTCSGSIAVGVVRTRDAALDAPQSTYKMFLMIAVHFQALYAKVAFELL